jgi:polyisoprenoid-binding protein YceI
MNLRKLTTTALLTLGLSASALAAKAIPEGTFALDGMHSKIGFEIPHLVISTVEGKFGKYEGTFTVDKKIDKSKVEVSIEVDSIDTGIGQRDTHLKSPDFFDAAKYQKITFTSSKVSQKNDTLTVTGDFKIKDVSKKITFDLKYLGAVKDGYGQEKLAFKGETKISRKEFGLKWSQAVEAGPVVGDEVKILLTLQAAAPKAAK